MRQLGIEEKAALLLTATDDEDNENHEMINSPSKVEHDNFPTATKHRRTYQHRRNSSPHPVLCFLLILGAFILGCISGVTIILYRMSQDTEQGQSLTHNSLQKATNIDLSIRTKLFQSITKSNFINLNHSLESDNIASNKLYEQWQTYSSSLSHVNKFTYDIKLAKYAPSTQWSGIQLLESKSDKELSKVDCLHDDNLLLLPSLTKSGTINANSIYYVNYGRQEDFAYLFAKKVQIADPEKSVVFMRRQSTIISQTEQIHQAIYYGFGGLVLFDDAENQQTTTTTNDRHSFFRQWARYSGIKERENFVNGISNTKDHAISLVVLSNDDVQRIFGSLQPDSNQWLACPTQWHSKPTTLKIGGTLSAMKLQLVANMQEVNVQLPVVINSIRGTIDAEQFIMIGYQLGAVQQTKIVNEIIQAYTTQIKNGWNPKRSILFCAWSGLDYDHYTIHRWLSDNNRLVDRNLVAYLDLGNGILANSTLNLHGSPLLEQVAHRAADFVPSPLQHDHTCHQRQKTTPSTMTMSNEEHGHHDHGRKRRDEGHDHHMQTDEQPQKTECEPHKLLDEWLRASNNRIGLNRSLGIVQMGDVASSAALFQLQYGIPSLLIEMTADQALTNDTFYVQNSPAIFGQEISPEVYVAYTQFISELIRQLIDEPLLAFNLTNYADQIDRHVIEYLAHYSNAYRSLGSHLGDSSEFSKAWSDLTNSLRKIQSRIDHTPRNDYLRLQPFNKQLIEFERLFLNNNPLPGIITADRHLLVGPAFGLTNTAVPFPFLSNLLYNIPEDPPTELCDTSKVFWSKLQEQIRAINRTLNGFDGLIAKQY